MLCYHSVALFTSKSDISASVICYLQRFTLVQYIGKPKYSFCCFGGCYTAPHCVTKR